MTYYIPRWFTRPETATHPSTNRAQCRLTSLIKPTPLTTTLRRHPIVQSHVGGTASAEVDDERSHCRLRFKQLQAVELQPGRPATVHRCTLRSVTKYCNGYSSSSSSSMSISLAAFCIHLLFAVRFLTLHYYIIACTDNTVTE